MPIDHIRLSQRARDQLVRLKRATGIRHWNELCRWAFCLSLSDPTVPTAAKIPADGAVEMTWKVFGGLYHEIYLALLKQRCHDDGLGSTDDVLSAQFRLHLHRGIAMLANDRQLKSIEDLVSKAVT